MSSLFAAYEEDLKNTMEEVKNIVKTLEDSITAQQQHAADPTRIYRAPPSSGPQSRSQELQAIQQCLSHAKDLLNSMHYEAMDSGPEVEAHKRAVEQYRHQVHTREKDYPPLKQRCTAADRSDLLAFGGSGNVMGEAADADTQAARLMSIQTTEKLQGGTKTLLEAEKYIHSSQALGQQSLSQLRQQRETIQGIQNTTGEVDGELLEARHVIQSMQRTAMKHKLYLWGLILLLVLFVVLIIYAKLK